MAAEETEGELPKESESLSNSDDIPPPPVTPLSPQIPFRNSPGALGSPTSPLSPSSAMYKKRTSLSKASSAKRRSSSKKNRSRFSIMRKSKRPPRLIRIVLQHDAMVLLEARRSLESGVISVIVAREVRSIVTTMRVTMPPTMAILMWIFSKQLEDPKDIMIEDGDAIFGEESLKGEWQKVLAADQRKLKLLTKEEEALKNILERNNKKDAINTIRRMVEETQSKDRFELLTSFDFERDQLVLIESIVSNIGCNLSCILLCVRIPSISLRFNKDIIKDDLGQMKSEQLMDDSLRQIEDVLLSLLDLTSLQTLSMTTSNKGVGVGSAVGVWAHRVTKEAKAIAFMQRLSRKFIARKIVAHKRAQMKSILRIQNSVMRRFFAKRKLKQAKKEAALKYQTNDSFGVLSQSQGLNALMGRTLLSPIDPLNNVNAEVVESLCRVHGGAKLISLGFGEKMLQLMQTFNVVEDDAKQEFQLSILRTFCLCLREELAREQLLTMGAGEVLRRVWSTCIEDYPTALQCLKAAAILANFCSEDIVITLFCGNELDVHSVGLGVPLVAMIGSDISDDINPTASVCGVATCITLDILQTLIKINVIRQSLANQTKVICLLLGCLQILAEKNEQLAQPKRYDPQEELGATGYFNNLEIETPPPSTYYPTYMHYRPSYSKVACESDKHNLNIADEWSVLRTERSEPLVLERCAVLLWTMAKDKSSWVEIHKQGGVETTCNLLKCSLWPLAVSLGSVLVSVLAKPNRRAKLSFMQAGAHRLLQEHLLLGHHEVRAPAKCALELLSETLKPMRVDEEEDPYGDELWGSDVGVRVTAYEMESFLSGWSQGSTSLQYNNDRDYEEVSHGDIHVPLGEFETPWDQRWDQRATGTVPPLYI